MKKKSYTTTIFFIMTVLLLGGTVYLSTQLQNTGDDGVTKIRKTKASAVTYTKSIDLNATPVISIGTTEPLPASTSGWANGSSKISPTIIKNSIPTVEKQIPTVAPTNVPTQIPTIAPQPTLLQSTVIPTVKVSVLPTEKLIAKAIVPTITVAFYYSDKISPTKSMAVPLITMVPTLRLNITPSIKPTLLTPSLIKTPTPKLSITQKPIVSGTVVKTLPQTGWVGWSLIILVIASTVVFVSFIL